MKPWVNYTWPGRLHLIIAGRDVLVYVTMWRFSTRLHLTLSRRSSCGSR